MFALLLALAVLAGLLIWLAEVRVEGAARGRLYDDVQALPARRAGLVLGTSPTTDGRPNLYYQYRLDAAVAAYRAGKVRDLILSGDNSRVNYDEPSAMRRDLIARGLPAARLQRDYAGFRTLDSVARARSIFGQSGFTVISQPFHNARAVYLARARGLDGVVALNARDVAGAGGWRTQLRERLARVQAILDVAFGTQPKFGGPPVALQ